MVKECPLCGETMHRKEREQVTSIPGTGQQVRLPVTEWVCRECDYYEEIDKDDR